MPDSYEGRVLMVKLPDNNWYRWRWIVRKNSNGRYVVRAPKIGVLIRHLDLKRDADYGPEQILPLNSIFYESKNRKSRKQSKSKSKTKSKRKSKFKSKSKSKRKSKSKTVKINKKMYR